MLWKRDARASTCWEVEETEMSNGAQISHCAIETMVLGAGRRWQMTARSDYNDWVDKEAVTS